MQLKKFLLIILFYSLIINNSFSIEPDVFVQSTVNRASNILSQNISKEDKIKKLKLIAKETVDIRGVGLYSLGAARKNYLAETKKNIEVLLNDSRMRAVL